MGAKREMIETRRQASRTQGGKKLVLLGEVPVVALVILQHHVNEGAGHEYDDGREQDGEQKSSERNHAQPPWKQRRMQEFRREATAERGCGQEQVAASRHERCPPSISG